MQVGGFLGSLVALVATLGLLGWLFGGLAVRGCARLWGPIWRASNERGFRAGLWRFRLTVAAFALLLAFVGWKAVLWLAPGAGGTPGWGAWGAQAAWGSVFTAAVLVCVAALWSVGAAARGTAAAFRRRRVLAGGGGAPLPAPEAGGAPGLPPGGGRRIVICCDGTGNRPDATQAGAAANTNV